MSHLSEEGLDQLVAAERARDYEPLNDWRTLAVRAREEGLIAEERAGWSAHRPWFQAAAAVLILVGGIAIGRTTIGLPQSEVSSDASAQQPAAGATLASSQSTGAGENASFASVDEASAALGRAAAEYQRATAYLAANGPGATTTRDSSAIYTARLAALDKVGNAMESALRAAPHDPVINQYYLATMGARVATQQLVARPVGVVLKRW